MPEQSEEANSKSSPSAKADMAAAAAPIIVPTPRDITGVLDRTVIGQTTAKRRLAIQVHNHYQRLLQKQLIELGATPVEKQKSNVLMLGPTGSGKTLLAQGLAKSLDVPFAMVDVSTMTELGYIGGKVEDAILSLRQAAKDNVKRAEMGIVYLDEFDKIAKAPGHGRDISGEGVQQRLLTVLAGTQVQIREREENKKKKSEPPIDTTDILFICGGAFVGLEEIIAKRIGKSQRKIGFNAEREEETTSDYLLSHVQPEDLMKFGFIPELVGRLPILAPLKELTKSDLIRILTEPVDAIIKQFQTILMQSNTRLDFEPAALSAIADQALKLKTGARGLRATLETILEHVQFVAPDNPKYKTVTITADMVRRGSSEGAKFEMATPGIYIPSAPQPIN